jgi:hypothetical protein
VFEDRTDRLRWTGLAGIAAAIAWTLGDALLLGNRASAAEFPHIAVYAGNARCGGAGYGAAVAAALAAPLAAAQDQSHELLARAGRACGAHQ